MGHNRNLTMAQGSMVSVVLISSALETIAGSKEAKRTPALREAVDNALKMIRAGEGGDKPREIFEPLRLACETRNEKLMVPSLDCIQKLISYSFFVEPETHDPPLASPRSPGQNGHEKLATDSQTDFRQPTLVDLVAHTITSCHTEATPDAGPLQIVKALLSLVLSSTMLIHQSSLLKAVRTVYNIFLMSPDPVNQTIAQGGLTQMVHHVFTRCNIGSGSLSASIDSSTLHSPRTEESTGMNIKGRRSSRPSLTPSTPETYPIPPETPTETSHPGEDEKSIAESQEVTLNGDAPNGSSPQTGRTTL